MPQDPNGVVAPAGDEHWERSAEAKWLRGLIDDHLRPALKAAERLLAELDSVEWCDAAGCERFFDGSDPRSGVVDFNNSKLHFCPACEMEASGRKAPTP